MYYFGARYYDPQVSRWESADPELRNYTANKPGQGLFEAKNLDLYTYAWNQPVVLQDKTGRRVVLSGKRRDINLLIKTVNKGLGLLRLKANKQGELSLKQTAAGPLTEREQAFSDIVGAIIKDPRVVNIEILRDSNKAAVGNFLGTIDAGDLATLTQGKEPGARPPSAPGLFGHEVVEQFQKQVVNNTVEYDVAHAIATQKESMIEGFQKSNFTSELHDPMVDKTIFRFTYSGHGKSFDFTFHMDPRTGKMSVP